MATVAASQRVSKLIQIAESLEDKAKDKLRNRAMNTLKQRKQASEARYEGYNFEVAAKAARTLAKWIDRNGDHPKFKKYNSAAAICEATRCKYHCGTGYYAETVPLYDEFYDASEEAGNLRLLVLDADDVASRKVNLELENKLSELRGSKIDGFFPTPDLVIQMMLPIANVEKGRTFLEPSAGIGSIADMVRGAGGTVVCVERNWDLCEVLGMKNHTFIRQDFLTLPQQPIFDGVLMNPPFENNQAIDHVRHAFGFLKKLGVLVAVLPGSEQLYQSANIKKRTEFSQWVSSNSGGYEWIKLPDGAFKEAFRSTGVNTSLLTMWR